MPPSILRAMIWRVVPLSTARNRRSKRNLLPAAPMKSRTVRHALSGERRSPRPSCWRKTVALSVGRRKRMVSTLGMSTPSLKRSTVKMTWSVPRSSAVDVRERETRKRLDGREDVLAALRSLPADEELAEGAVAEHLSESGAALLEEPLPMRDEEEPMPRQGATQPRVIEGGDQRLAGSGGGDHEVPVMPLISLDLEGLEDVLLVRVRAKVEDPEVGRDLTVRALRREGALDTLPVARGVVANELVRSPVRLEGSAELGELWGGVPLREPHVPLQSLEQRGVGQVR